MNPTFIIPTRRARTAVVVQPPQPVEPVLTPVPTYDLKDYRLKQSHGSRAPLQQRNWTRKLIVNGESCECKCTSAPPPPPLYNDPEIFNPPPFAVDNPKFKTPPYVPVQTGGFWAGFPNQKVSEGSKKIYQQAPIKIAPGDVRGLSGTMSGADPFAGQENYYSHEVALTPIFSGGGGSGGGSGRGGVNWQSIINQGVGLTSQFLGSRGKYQTSQIGGQYVGLIPGINAQPQPYQQQYQQPYPQPPVTPAVPSVDSGINGIFTFVQNNLALVGVAAAGAFLLFRDPPKRRS